jgi:hypothetical protein
VRARPKDSCSAARIVPTAHLKWRVIATPTAGQIESAVSRCAIIASVIVRPIVGPPMESSRHLDGGVALFVVGICSILGWSSGDWKSVLPWPGLAIPVVLVVGAVDGALPFASAIVLTVVAVIAVVTGIIRRQRSPVDTSET